MIDSFPASGDFCRLLITFANLLLRTFTNLLLKTFANFLLITFANLSKGRLLITFANSLDPDMDQNCLTLWCYSWKIYRRFTSPNDKFDAVITILMHLFIFSVEKMYYLHKTTSAVSCVKPNVSQWEATLRCHVPILSWIYFTCT